MADGVPPDARVEILIAEDSPTQAQRLQRLLEKNGYHVRHASNGQQALDAAQKHKPTLIISDVVMPVMDGYTLCREVKANAQLSDTPVILVTTLSDPEDVVRGLACRADGFILKPYDERYLLGRVQVVLLNRDVHQSERTGMGVEIFFNGQKHFITADRLQILNLLLSTYEAAVEKNKELSRFREQLEETNADLNQLTRELEERVNQRTKELESSNAALRESEARVRLTIDTALDAVITMEALGTVIDWNAQAEALFGWKRSEVLGKPLAELIIPPEQRHAHTRGLQHFLATGEGPILGRRIEVTALHREGREFPIELSIAPMMFNGAWKFSGFARDLTQQKQLEAQLVQAQKMESVGQLASGIAHDFNNLLTVINSTSELAVMDLPEGDPLREELAEIRHAGTRAAALTRQLLAFSRKQILQPTIVSLNDLVRNMESLLRRVLGTHIEVSVTLADDLVPVKVDPGQFEQVILNLAINSRDAMPKGGKLALETRNVAVHDRIPGSPALEPAIRALVTIADTGIGMDEETQRKMFEPFFTTKGPGKGTGLGLSTAYGIIKQSGGDIQVTSAVGEGTTIRITLPPAEEADLDRQGGMSATGELPATRGHETILVVEDDETVRRLVRRILEGAGYRIVVASDAADALASLARQNGPIDLVLTDLVMPGMNGRELAERVSESHPETKILFTSGFTEDAIVRRDVQEEGVHFIGKPYSATSLTKKVREVLESDAPGSVRDH